MDDSDFSDSAIGIETMVMHEEELDELPVRGKMN
jgi:hypothetical protein